MTQVITLTDLFHLALTCFVVGMIVGGTFTVLVLAHFGREGK